MRFKLLVLALRDLRGILEDKYKEYTVEPFVTIRVEGIASSEVFLVGQVAQTGRLSFGW